MNDEKFLVHSVVLASQSQYFYDFFFQTADSKPDIVCLNDVNSFALEKVLKYFYTGQLSLEGVNSEQFLDLLKLASRYELLELEHDLAEKFVFDPNVKNFIEIFAKTSDFGSKKLEEKCLEHFWKQLSVQDRTDLATHFTDGQIFKVLQFKQPKLASIKLKLVENWLKTHPDCSDDTKLKLLELIDLSEFQTEELLSLVKPSKLFSAEKILDTIEAHQKWFKLPAKENQTIAVFLGRSYFNPALSRIVTASIDYGFERVIMLDLKDVFLFNGLGFFCGPKPLGYRIAISKDLIWWRDVVNESLQSWPIRIDFPEVVGRYIKMFGFGDCWDFNVWYNLTK